MVGITCPLVNSKYNKGGIKMLDFTIRKAVEEMRKVSSQTVTCNNGTTITIWEINADKMDHIGKIKWNPDGSVKTIRGFYCAINESKKRGIATVWKEFPKDRKHWLYNPKLFDEDGYDQNFFHDNEYYLSEREMNGFISDNGGIDHYLTIGQYAYMMADCLALAKEAEESYQ